MHLSANLDRFLPFFEPKNVVFFSDVTRGNPVVNEGAIRHIEHFGHWNSTDRQKIAKLYFFEKKSKKIAELLRIRKICCNFVADFVKLT